MTRLIIARHGNTFNPEDTITRVGLKTDLPLVKKGQEQGLALGKYLKDNNIIPDEVYCSNLMRTHETATLALQEIGIKSHIYRLDIFNEIDYGEDENKPEAQVIKRIGRQAINNWDEHAIIPDGWNANPHEIIKNWHGFANQISKTHDEITNNIMDLSEVILVVTSNGIARFAPHITNDFEAFANKYPIKLSTGALGILEFSNEKWSVIDWNIRPLLDR